MQNLALLDSTAQSGIFAVSSLLRATQQGARSRVSLFHLTF
jgi:hypothetical protein